HRGSRGPPVRAQVPVRWRIAGSAAPFGAVGAAVHSRSGGVHGGSPPWAAMTATETPSATQSPAAATFGRQMLNKVPEVTIFFWIIKIMCTTVGETAADYLNVNLGFGLTKTTYV